MTFKGVKITDALIRRFWSKVDIRSKKECWIWKPAGLGNYGYFWIPGLRSLPAHRLALFFHTGKETSLDTIHSCDNPPCCNPFHLSAATHLENMQDMNRKGRRICECGEARHCAKLNDEKVRTIRKLFDSAQRNKALLARQYGVSTRVIRNVVERKAWKHVA